MLSLGRQGSFLTCIPLISICGLIFFTHLSAFSLEDKELCTSALISKKTLEQWKLTKEDIEHWLSQNNTSSVTRATLGLTEDLKTAPNPALTLISILSHTQLGNADAEKTLIRHFRQYNFAKDAEVVLGHDLKDLAAPLTNLYFAERLVTGDSKAWLKKVLASPVKALLIADAMAKMPKPVQGEPFYLYKIGFSHTRLRELIVRFRQHDSLDLNLREITQHNLLIAYNMAKLKYASNLKPHQLVKVFNSPGAMRSIRDPDLEMMVEWTAEKLTHTPTAVSNPPEAWIKFHRLVDTAIQLPVAKWPKLLDKELRGFTSADLLLIDLIPAIVVAINFESGKDLLEDILEPKQHAQQIRHLLLTAPTSGLYRQADAAAITNAILALANTSIANASDTRARLKAETHAIIQELLRLSPRADRKTSDVSPSKEDTAEQDLFAEIEIQQHYEEWKPYLIEESIGPQQAISTSDDSEPLEPYIDETVPLTGLNAHTVYEIEFARPNSKFSGRQRFVFSARVLSQIIKYESRDVSPMSWLRAMKMGLAKSHGQRGIKILSFVDSEETFFEVKLVQTSYRLLGRYQNGIWHIEAMVNTHP